MPPITKNFFEILAKNFSQFYHPDQLYIYLLSLLILPPLFEIYHRFLGFFKQSTHRKSSSIIFKPILAALSGFIITYFNQIHLNLHSEGRKVKSVYKKDMKFLLEIAIYTTLEILLRHSKKILPSSYLHPGSYSSRNSSIKLTAWDQAQSPKNIKNIQIMGQKYGCHTCGTKNRVNKLFNNESYCSKIFIADHQPPRAIVRDLILPVSDKSYDIMKRLEQASLYPQCNECSLKQANNVRSLLKEYDNLSISEKKRKVAKCNPLKVIKDNKSHGLGHVYFVLPWSFIVNFLYKYYF